MGSLYHSAMQESESISKLPLEYLKQRYECPHFRILVTGRANAGKTTILEKVCNVQQGTKPIVYDQKGKKVDTPWNKFIKKSKWHVLTPSMLRGQHNIELQITYPGSNFIFHDSRGFESGSQDEMNIVRKFIADRSSAADVGSRLHAIWYCIPMDDSRPLAPAELEFFQHSTGQVPVVLVFTKFDARIIVELNLLSDELDDEARLAQARINAKITLQDAYIRRVNETTHPPARIIHLEDMHEPGAHCPELTEKTLEVIDDAYLRKLFVSVQRNNVSLCVKEAIIGLVTEIQGQRHTWVHIVFSAMCYFPHCWSVSWKYDRKAQKKIEHGQQEWLDLWENFHFQDDFLKNFLPKVLPLFGLDQRASRLEGTDEIKLWRFLTAVLVILEHSSWDTTSKKPFATSANLFLHDQHYQRVKEYIGSPPEGQELCDYLYNQVSLIFMPHSNKRRSQ